MISDDIRLKVPKIARRVPWFLADVLKDGISSTYVQSQQRIYNIYIYLYVSYQSVYTGSVTCITNVGKNRSFKTSLSLSHSLVY